MATLTTNYSFNLPTIGGDIDVWGGLHNDNFTKLDNLLHGVGGQIRPALSEGNWKINATAVLASAAELNKLDGVTASTAELNKLAGLTALTADLNLLTGAAAGGLTAAELMFVKAVTSDIQAQLDTKLGTDTDLAAIAALTVNRGDLIVGGAAGWQDLALGSAGRLLMSDGTDLVYNAAFIYTDATASRAVNTNYTNSGNRPIAVVISLQYNGANTDTSFQIDGVPFSRYAIGQGFTGLQFSHSVIVPAGAVYRMNINGGSTTLIKWHEATL